MIAVVDVAVQAANVSMPLFPWRAFRNSYSSVRVRNVPRKIGKWNITNVSVQVTYPDGSIKTADAVLTGGVWVATIEGTATAGTSLQGYKILASGIDENGQSVSNYCLGRGDVTILEDDGELIPENVITYTRLLSSEPAQPKDGDLYQISGTWYIYQDGTAYPIGDDSGLIAQLSSDITQLSGQVQDKADKQIEVPGTVSYRLPSAWWDLILDTRLSFSAVEGDVITWGTATQPKMTYNVKTHNLEYTTSDSGQTLPMGVYAPDEIPSYVSWSDDQTGTYYALNVDGFDEYEFTVYITEDVVYAEGGADRIYATVDEKIGSLSTIYQTKLTDTQISAIDSVVDEKATIIDFGNGDISVFNWAGTIDCPLLVSAGLMPEGSGTEQAPEWIKTPRSIKFGEGVTRLGDYIMYNCGQLSSATLPQSLTAIDTQVFQNCSTLRSIDIPANVKSIGESAFSTCIRLSSVSIPSNLTSINVNAFFMCSSLKNITIPKTIQTISLDTFYGCDQLTSVVFENGQQLSGISAMTDYPWGIENTDIISTWHDASQEWVKDYAVHNLSGVANAISMPLSSYEQISATADVETLYVITED